MGFFKTRSVSGEFGNTRKDIDPDASSSFDGLRIMFLDNEHGLTVKCWHFFPFHIDLVDKC